MREPGNHEAVVGTSGTIWVRVDELPAQDGAWWGWSGGVAVSPSGKSWQHVLWACGHQLKKVDPARAAQALTEVRQARSR